MKKLNIKARSVGVLVATQSLVVECWCGVELNADKEGLSRCGEGASCSGEWADATALCGEGDEEIGVAQKTGAFYSVETGVGPGV